jgi:general secretion pathway protein L
MDDTLLIHFNPLRSESTWALVNNAGELTSKIQQGDLAEAEALATTHKSIILLDNILVHINSLQLPTQNRQKMLRAIPFALEEQLADDIEEFHFVAAKPDSANNTAVAGIRTETLQAILDKLAEHKIRPDAIIPDALCLAGSTKQW